MRKNCCRSHIGFASDEGRAGTAGASRSSSWSRPDDGSPALTGFSARRPDRHAARRRCGAARCTAASVRRGPAPAANRSCEISTEGEAGRHADMSSPPAARMSGGRPSATGVARIVTSAHAARGACGVARARPRAAPIIARRYRSHRHSAFQFGPLRRDIRITGFETKPQRNRRRPP